jgi:hypothetical protein
MELTQNTKQDYIFVPKICETCKDWKSTPKGECKKTNNPVGRLYYGCLNWNGPNNGKH